MVLVGIQGQGAQDTSPRRQDMEGPGGQLTLAAPLITPGTLGPCPQGYPGIWGIFSHGKWNKARGGTACWLWELAGELSEKVALKLQWLWGSAPRFLQGSLP